VDWKALLRRHPTFSSLDASEIALELLTGLWLNAALIWDDAGRDSLLVFLERDLSGDADVAYEVLVMLEFLKATGWALQGNEEGHNSALSRLRAAVSRNNYLPVRSSLRQFDFDPETYLGASEDSSSASMDDAVSARSLAAWKTVP
jgi:hypothetical protein